MKSLHFERARAAYDRGDFVEALKGYYACLKEDSASFAPGDVGLVYYRLGNCLLKIRSFQEACTTYRKALEDPAYNDKAAVQVNLGKSQIGLGDYEGAVVSFNAALADPSYQKQYQAQMGLGTALSRLGMALDAGTAYRNAALDEDNPNPTKALVQLAACFTSLGRPYDAIETYKAIFDFDPTGATRSKVFESMGQAYVATRQYKEAVDSFTAAIAEGRYALSNDAFADYQKALLQAAPAELTGVASVLDIREEQMAGHAREAHFDSFYSYEDDRRTYGAGNVPSANDTGFFTATDEDLIEMSKSQLKKERKLRHVGIKVMLGITIVLLLLLGVAVFLFWQGYGYPSQQTTITQLFAAHAQGGDVLPYWSSADEDDIYRLMDEVARTEQVEIVYLHSDTNLSEATVIAYLPAGGALKYDIKLERQLLGWKVYGITLVFDSQLP